MYYNPTTSKWLVHYAYTEEDAKKHLSNVSSAPVVDGWVPMGEQTSSCWIDEKWQERSVTITALTADQMDSVKETAKEEAATAAAEAAEEEAAEEEFQRDRERDVKEIFAMFDADEDGRLNKDEYKAYLMGLGDEWGKDDYTDERWDEAWLEECVHEHLNSSTTTEGITCECLLMLIGGSLR